MQDQQEKSMLVLVDPKDSRAVRNKDNVLAIYDVMINQKKSMEVARYLGKGYLQHNPLLENDLGTAKFFEKVTSDRAQARVVVHKIIAVGEYVWAHVNFLNLTTDDPQDTGIAGVDIFKMDPEGRAIEHWDVLQLVGGPTNAVPWFAPNIPAANANGMF